MLNQKLLKGALLAVILALLTFAGFPQTLRSAPNIPPEPINIQVDVNKVIDTIEPIWSWFGYDDEPNYTYMKDGKKLLGELAALSPGPVYIRAHNLLTTGDGTAAFKWGSTNAYTEDRKAGPYILG